jgi:hypothetical protein
MIKVEDSKPKSELSRGDIELGNDVVTLKGHKFYRPYITAAAINDDTIKGNGTLGGVMLAQETARQYSPSTGLPRIDEQIFVVMDDATEIWDALKVWLKAGSVTVMETRIPNAKFMSLFEER